MNTSNLSNPAHDSYMSGMSEEEYDDIYYDQDEPPKNKVSIKETRISYAECVQDDF